MRLEEFIRNVLRRTTEETNRMIRKHRHVTIISTKTAITIYDYDTKIATIDKISRIALVDAEHYTPTTAKTITYVVRALLGQGYRIYRVPYIDDLNDIELQFDHKYIYIANEPVEVITAKGPTGTKTIAFVYNYSMLRKNLKNTFIFGEFIGEAKKIYTFPMPEIPSEFPITITPAKPPKEFEFSSKRIPKSLDDFEPQKELEDLDYELIETIDHILRNNLMKFTKFSVIDNNTIIIKRTGGMLRKTGDYEVLKFNYDIGSFGVIIPKIEHTSIPLLPYSI